MRKLRCPDCGHSPALRMRVPCGTDSQGYMLVEHVIQCPCCRQTLHGSHSSPHFQRALATWALDPNQPPTAPPAARRRCSPMPHRDTDTA